MTNEQKADAARKANQDLLNSIRPGDLVTILVSNGIGRNGIEWKPKVGRAVMRGPAGWVLNLGGKYGTPGIASESNLIAVNGGRK
jgi:hypothetical protein